MWLTTRGFGLVYLANSLCDFQNNCRRHITHFTLFTHIPWADPKQEEEERLSCNDLFSISTLYRLDFWVHFRWRKPETHWFFPFGSGIVFPFVKDIQILVLIEFGPGFFCVSVYHSNCIKSFHYESMWSEFLRHKMGRADNWEWNQCEIVFQLGWSVWSISDRDHIP